VAVGVAVGVGRGRRAVSVNLGLVSPAPVRGLGLVPGRGLVPGNRGLVLSGREPVPVEPGRNGRGAV